ncbi:MAG: AbrB/MazE/SpoVT family DNA-binding domain-containing protein [Syntrophobacteraceae bacterium]
MELIKIRRKFQLTLPAVLRDKLGVTEGDYVRADIEDGKIVLRPVELDASRSERSRFSKEREEAYAALDEIWSKVKNEEPGQAARLVKEAVKAVRKA